jgi:hypothetical protein
MNDMVGKEAIEAGEGVERGAGSFGSDEDGAGPARARGPWRRVTLSVRDWEVLSWAHEQKFLMFAQVARWFPAGPENPHARRKEAPTPGTLRRRARPGNWYVLERLRKLVRFDVLRRVPVYTEAAGALLPGRLGFELLIGSGRSNGLARLDEIDWKNFVHDRAATDLRWLLEKDLGGTGWRSERVLRRELESRHIPDGLVTMPGRGTLAIELELTRKSLPRYLDIFSRYVRWTTPRLDRVLYVVPEKADLAHLFKAVLPAVLAKGDLWGVQAPDLSRFRFTTSAALAERRAWWTTSTPASPSAGDL